MENKKVARRGLKAPAIDFPGGHIQIVNPRCPIEGVWSDILYLRPCAELPSHVHKQTSSLLICIRGNGEIGVDGQRTPLRKGICAFIPKGAEHYVKAGRKSALTCLSINEGIIKPGAGADMSFTTSKDGRKSREWAAFIENCSSVAAAFQQTLKNHGADWAVFSVKL